MWHFLIAHGLWASLIGAVVTFIVFGIGSWLLGLPKAWRKHTRELERIRDHLDTSTPGGLTAVVDALRKQDDIISAHDE